MHTRLQNQILEESTKLQNIRLEQQQLLQRSHLKEWKNFAEKYSSDHISIGSASDRLMNLAERSSLDSEHSQTSLSNNVSMGTASL